MKVLQLISGLKAGGAEHFVLELCRQSRKVHDTHMDVLTMSAVDEISHKFKEAGVGIICPAHHEKRQLKAFQSLRLLLKQPHKIYHAHMFHACIIACMAKIFRPSVKVIFTLHNDYVPQWHRQILLFVTRPLRYADIIFPEMKRRWFQKKNVAIIPTGIDFERFEGPYQKPEVFTFLFAGRLQPEKNPLFLVQFAKALQPEYQFHIGVAGDGPLKKTLEAKIEAANLQQYFTLYGQVDDMPKFLSRGHCLLLPSFREGMPMIYLEAAASSLPVIATPTGNLKHLINEDEGYVERIENFEIAARHIIDHYGVAEVKAQNVRKKLKTFSAIENVYALHQQLYSH